MLAAPLDADDTRDAPEEPDTREAALQSDGADDGAVTSDVVSTLRHDLWSVVVTSLSETKSSWPRDVTSKTASR